jgi:hypothetical protein
VAFGCASLPEGEAGTQDLRLPSAAETPSSPRRLVLISVSGLMPQAYGSSPVEPGIEPRHDAPMPTLAQLAREGVSAEAMRAVTPAARYPAHASLVTGLRPDRHGIVADRLLGDHGVRGTPYWHASRLQGSPLWQVAQQVGLRVAALGWPSMVGAAVDLLLPDLVPTRSGQSWEDVLAGATTPWLLERARALDPETLRSERPPARARDALFVEIACEIAASETPPALWLLQLDEPGAVALVAGPGSEAAQVAWARADARLRRLLTCFGESGMLAETAFVVVGDRRLLPVHTMVQANQVLLRAGLVTPALAPNVGIASWRAIVRSNGATAFVYASGAETALRARDALLAEAERTGAFRVMSAAELQELRADPQAWFGLEAAPGYLVSDAVGGPFLRAAPVRAAGGSLPDTPGSELGFVAWGAGLRQGVVVPRMEQIDVAPTLAALLGLALEGAEGRPLIGIVSGGMRRAP